MKHSLEMFLVRAVHVGALLLLVPALLYQPAGAQQITGTLTGIVNDSAGAVIPGASVALSNEASGSTLRSQTNGEGYFSIAGVAAGSYTLRVQSEGFSVLERTGIVFRPGDKRHLSDLSMKLGAVTETVTISAAPETIAPVDSGEQSSVVTGEQLRELSVVGRSAAEFIKILPGMAPTGSGIFNAPGFNGEVIGINGNGDGGNGRQSALGYFSGNGQRGNAMDIVTDGANTADPGCNCATPVNPNIDMIQEFKVLTGTYSAEHAKGPIVMNAVTKSGGKDFHGTGYYYFRDYRLNSNDWALNRAGQERPKNQFQFPGGNIGGPVYLPGTSFNQNRDKLFFFAGYEYYKQRLDTGVLQAIVPTQEMRNGNFSDAAYLASLGGADARKVPTGEGIVNGIIPASMWENRGKILMDLLPMPNVDPAANAGKNYVEALLLDQPMHQFSTKVDYNISDYTKLFVRYNLQREKQHFPVQLWGRSGDHVPYPSEVLGENASDSISASLTNVLSPTTTNEFIFGYTFIDFPNTLVNPEAVSRSALGYPIEGIYDNGIDQVPNVRFAQNLARIENRGGFNPVYPATKWLWSASDNLSMFKGSHSLKVGFYWGYIKQEQPNGGHTQGRWQFRTNHKFTTGNSYADALTGIFQNYFEQNLNTNLIQGYHVLEGYVQDSWKVTSRLTLDVGARFSHLQNWTDKGSPEVGFAIFDPSNYSNDPADLGALTGLEYTAINPNLPLSGTEPKALWIQPRLGFALDVAGNGKTILRGGFGVFRYNEPTAVGGAYHTAAGMRTNTRPAGIMADVDGVLPRDVKTGITVVDPNDDRKPVSYNWSFEVSRRLMQDTMFRAAYVGNKGDDLLNGGGVRNINQVPYGAMFDDPDANADNYRPFQNYSAINVIRHNFYSNYHSLQSMFVKQARNLNLQASYTFSKALGIRGSGDTLADSINPRNNYGVLGIDRTHMLNVSYVVFIPDLAKTNPFLKGVANGWQFSGISTWASGVEITANDAINFGITGYLSDGRRISDTAVNGTPSLLAQPLLVSGCDPTANLAKGQYVNGACFAPPDQGVNGPIMYPYYFRGPALFSHDLSLFKNFQIDEHKRIQFRISAYNFVNHPLDTFRANDNNLDLNFDQAGNLDAPNFGFVSQKTGRRVLQLGLKFYF